MAENTGDRVKRRTVLKTVGSGVFVTSVAGSANAKQSARDLYNKSLKIKKRTGSVERWREFLRNHGFKLATDDAENKVAFDKPKGEASTERYYDTNISFSLTLSELCNDVYNVDLSWQYDPLAEDAIRTPDLPKDQVALYWDPTQWKPHGDQNYDSSDNGTDNPNVEDYGYTLLRGETPPNNGVKFDMFAHKAANIGDIADSLFFIGQEIEPIGDYSQDARGVFGQYAINYSGGSIDSVSLSYPSGLSVSTSWSTKTEYIAYNGTGTNKEFIEAYQDNATYNCYPY